MKNEGCSIISVWILARVPVAGAACWNLNEKKLTLLRLSLASFSPHHYSWRQRSPFHLFITHQKLLNALKSPKSKKSLQESTNRASERVPFSTSYLHLALAHARNSRVKKWTHYMRSKLFSAHSARSCSPEILRRITNPILERHIYIYIYICIYNKTYIYLSHKLRCYTRISGVCWYSQSASLHVTRLWRHSITLMNEQQSFHDSQYKFFIGAFSNYGG